MAGVVRSTGIDGAVGVILAEAPPPLQVYWEESGDLSIVNGDFDGDGSKELVVLGTPAEGAGSEFAVLDGTTLQTLAFRSEVDGYALKVDVLDLDGNGVDEVITAEVGDLGVTFSAWSLADRDLSLVATDSYGVPCEGWSFLRGDYDADGYQGLAIVWQEYCEDYFELAELGPPQVVTLFGGSEPKFWPRTPPFASAAFHASSGGW